MKKHHEEYQLACRKNHPLRGFAISAPGSLAKGKRKRKPICLECVKQYYGPVTQCANKLTVTVGSRSGDSVGAAEIWFQHKTREEAWSQMKELLGKEVGNLEETAEEDRLVFSEHRKSTAAQAALHGGRKAGEIPRSNAKAVVRQNCELLSPRNSSVCASRCYSCACLQAHIRSITTLRHTTICPSVQQFLQTVCRPRC